MTTNKTYAELLKEASISITPNDAVFMADLVSIWMSNNTQLITQKGVTHLTGLIATLRGEAGC